MLIGVIIGSTRKTRKAKKIAQWVEKNVTQKDQVTLKYIDILEFDLPFFDEPNSPRSGEYVFEHTKVWSKAISELDAYIIITPEYNLFPPGVLKNALDYLYQEWNNKSVGFIGYGFSGGKSAVKYLQKICLALKMNPTKNNVFLSFSEDFTENHQEIVSQIQIEKLNDMLSEITKTLNKT